MPSVSFAVESAAAVPFAAVPTIGFRLRVANGVIDQRIDNIALRCQIMIDANHRSYDRAEMASLRDLFGEPDRWSQTLHPLLWTHVNLSVPSFTGSIVTSLNVPCTFDFAIGATKYFHAVRDADIQLTFLFSGTSFYSARDGSLHIGQIAWDQEGRFSLPANVWHDLMEAYYPNGAWLRLRRDVFEHLNDYKTQRGIGTFEEAIERLLSSGAAPLTHKGAAL